jgi:hypothetical protein
MRSTLRLWHLGPARDRIKRRGVTAACRRQTITFALPQVNLVAGERTVKESYIGTCVSTRDLPGVASSPWIG